MQFYQVVLVQGVADVTIDLLIVDVGLLEQLELAVEEVLNGGRVLTEIYTLLGAGFRLQGSLRIACLDFARLDLVDEFSPGNHIVL